MANELTVTTFQRKPQRSIIVDGEKLWHYLDSCEILKINPTHGREYTDKAEFRLMEVYSERTIKKTGRKYTRLQKMLFITGKGLRDIARRYRSPYAQAYIDALLEVQMPAMQQEIIELKAQSPNQLEQVLATLASTVQLFAMQFDARIAKIEKAQEAQPAKKMLPQVTAGNEMGRAEAVRLVATVGVARKLDSKGYGEYYQSKFDRLSDLHHINIHQRAQLNDCKQLDIVMKLGLIGEFTDMVKTDLERIQAESEIDF